MCADLTHGLRARIEGWFKRPKKKEKERRRYRKYLHHIIIEEGISFYPRIMRQRSGRVIARIPRTQGGEGATGAGRQVGQNAVAGHCISLKSMFLMDGVKRDEKGKRSNEQMYRYWL